MRRAERPAKGSSAQALAAARAAGCNHLAAARGGHAGAITVTALAHELARLIGPLHGLFSAGLEGRLFRMSRRTVPADDRAACAKVTRLIRERGLARQCKAGPIRSRQPGPSIPFYPDFQRHSYGGRGVDVDSGDRKLP